MGTFSNKKLEGKPKVCDFKKYTKCDWKKLLLYRVHRLINGMWKYLCLYPVPVSCEGNEINGRSQIPHGISLFLELDKHLPLENLISGTILQKASRIFFRKHLHWKVEIWCLLAMILPWLLALGLLAPEHSPRAWPASNASCPRGLCWEQLKREWLCH